jgi:[acyl-carrier-protein] S-malonyltransferase
VTDPVEVRAMLARQVTGSVRWSESIRHLVAAGHRTFIELGPGRVLAGLVAKVSPEAQVWSIEDGPSLEAAVEALQS